MHRLSLVKFEDNDFTLDVRADFENDTLWLTQDEISKLFGRDQSVISRHIFNILKDGEVDEKSNMQKMQIANSDKLVKTIVWILFFLADIASNLNVESSLEDGLTKY